MRYIFSLLLLLHISSAYGQNYGSVYGTIKDKNTQAYLIAADIYLIAEDTIISQSDELGKFNMEAPVGTYRILVQIPDYKDVNLYSINVTSGNAQNIEIEMEAAVVQLEDVVINYNKTVRATDMVTPLATQKMTAEEIKVNPGGNFDVSKVIQVLPGVGGGTSANRNDIIVRGGGPSENVYYLDGIEIPVLNHFQTQGASGGANGLLNVSFIDNVQLASSAFDSRYDNALASTFIIKQRNGNPNKLSGNIRLSGSEVAATFEGPLSDKTTFLASARRSYLKLLFQVLDLPIRPDYWDFQYKVHHKLNSKSELTLIGLGAIDHFRLEKTKEDNAENEYLLRSNPIIDQWNYTVGTSFKRLIPNGYYTIALSRNMFNNGITRYENNANISGNPLFKFNSDEIENKLRMDVNKFVNGWKYSYGVSAQLVKYNLDAFNTISSPVYDSAGSMVSPAVTISTDNAIQFYKFGAFVHTSKYFWNEKFLLSGGIRTDMNTFTNDGMNPLQTLSPRLSAAYNINNQWNVSASLGSYYKIPPYTSLGYKDNAGEMVNQNMKYINAIHYTIGTQYVPRNDFRFTFEAFYKDYRNYPVSALTGISIANIGSDFSAIGNEPYLSMGKGRVYGVEAYVQQKLVHRLFYIVSATLYKSSFTGLDGEYRPSSWDYGYILSTAIGYKFKKDWDLGLKYRIAGGQPFTPYDGAASRAAYLTTGRGVYDYSQLNSNRLPLFHQLDLRLDKKYNFKNTSLIAFVDFQNVLLYKTPYQPKYTFQRNGDNTGFATTDGQPIRSDGSNAIPVILDQRTATIVPSVGFIFEF